MYPSHRRLHYGLQTISAAGIWLSLPTTWSPSLKTKTSPENVVSPRDIWGCPEGGMLEHHIEFSGCDISATEPLPHDRVRPFGSSRLTSVDRATRAALSLVANRENNPVM